jgi:anti-anti-sigma regulatory factor
MKVTQRPVALALLGILTIGTVLVFISEIVNQGLTSQANLTLVAILLELAVLFVYWRGWEPARYVIVILTTLFIAFGTQEPWITEQSSITLFIPPALALILATPIWVAGSMLVAYIALLVRAGGQGVYADPVTFLICAIVIGGIVLGRLITDTALASARDHARRAEEEKTRAEEQARELAEANDLMNTQLDQQQQLLDLVATLETPAVPLADGVLFAPIVGHVDTRRAQTLTTRLLHEVSEQQARLIVLDISGVSVMDTSVAKALLSTAQALRLLGCEVTLSGISAAIAMTLINLGISLDGVTTARSPQEALSQHIGAAVTITSNGNGKNLYN